MADKPKTDDEEQIFRPDGMNPHIVPTSEPDGATAHSTPEKDEERDVPTNEPSGATGHSTPE